VNRMVNPSLPSDAEHPRAATSRISMRELP
jgi:hypothetical protein